MKIWCSLSLFFCCYYGSICPCDAFEGSFKPKVSPGTSKWKSGVSPPLEDPAYSAWSSWESFLLKGEGFAAADCICWLSTWLASYACVWSDDLCLRPRAGFPVAPCLLELSLDCCTSLICGVMRTGCAWPMGNSYWRTWVLWASLGSGGPLLFYGVCLGSHCDPAPFRVPMLSNIFWLPSAWALFSMALIATKSLLEIS